MSTDSSDGDDAVPAPDPTLCGLGAGVADGGEGFPDTASGTHLVLYQTEDGAVDLRWRIAPVDIAHARAAFGGADSHAVLRLYHLGGRGDDRLMAHADLGSDTNAEGGVAHYAGGDTQGLLRAEIGLASADGGWLLVARSNALPAAAPVAGPFQRAHAPAPAAPPTVAALAGTAPRGAPSVAGPTAPAAVPAAPEQLRPGSEQPASQRSEPPRPAPQLPEPQIPAPPRPEPLRLTPEFPLVQPVLSALAAAGAAPGGLDAPPQTPAGDPARDAAAGAAAGAGTSPGAPAAAGLPVGAGGGNDASLGPALPLGRADGQPPPEPPPGGVVPRLTQRPPRTSPGAPGQPAAAADGRSQQQAQPAPGSGPVRPAAGEATLVAELVVHGSAPPHTLLDLGGHTYRVGPGGRFELRIPIRERDVILRVLATLPRLPVAGRPDAELQDAAPE